MQYHSWVGRKEKRIEALLKFPPFMRFSEVKAILEDAGWQETGGKGSHHRFTKHGEREPIDVATVNGREVKRIYLKEIAARLKLKE
jgi:predicted RNA binding protein YcfA (HicA-like mRNA interferase family)